MLQLDQPVTAASAQQRTHHHVAIIGSGFGGLGTAINLKREGLSDFVILERADDVGGVWRDNTYPGCACDVPSNLYSFSFAPNPDWSRSYSPQGEIWTYLQRCADEYGLRPHLRLQHEVREARWDDRLSRWLIETSQGRYSADILVAAAGALSEPAIPDLPGLDSFAGPWWHSARWNHDVDLAGTRVAVVGTGASAIQFIPAIQPEVAYLTLFQRTPPWVLPRLDRDLSQRERRLYGRIPLAQRAQRLVLYGLLEMYGVGFRRPALMKRIQKLALNHLHSAVTDPELRAKLTPSYTIGCKRVLLSDTYYPALAQPNVAVVTDGISTVTPHTVVDAAGVEHPVDVIILGTGFRVTDYPFGRHIYGHDGRSLDDVWQGSPRAYLGTTVAGFPNLFLLQGPNTGLGHTSVIYMMEAQMAHITKAIRYMQRRGVSSIEPHEQAQAQFVTEVDADMQRTVWLRGGCQSWYLDQSGRNSTLWPGSTLQFRRRVARFDPTDYRLRA